MQWQVVDDLESFRTSGTQVLAPGTEDNPGNKVMVKMAGDHGALLTFAAKKGFKNLTLIYLRLLVVHLQIAYSGTLSRMTLKECMEALLKHSLGANFKEEAVEKALENRNKDDMDETYSLDPGLFNLEQEDVFGEEADEDLEEEVRHWQALRTKQLAKKAREEAKDIGKAAMGSSTSSSSSSSTVPGAQPQQRQRVFVQIATNGYSAAEAQKWAPPNVKLYTDDQRESRWQARSKELFAGSGQKSKSYGPRSHCTDFGAMKLVLESAWVQHTRRSGTPCPWHFEDEADE